MITSLSTQPYQAIWSLNGKKSRSRNKEGLFIAEGIRMFGEAPQGKLREVYYSESFLTLLETGKPSRQIRPYR